MLRIFDAEMCNLDIKTDGVSLYRIITNNHCNSLYVEAREDMTADELEEEARIALIHKFGRNNGVYFEALEECNYMYKDFEQE